MRTSSFDGYSFQALERRACDLQEAINDEALGFLPCHERGPVFEKLALHAAQGSVLHIDDSYVRILELMEKRREVLVADAQLAQPERTGLFTTAVVSITQEGPIALF